MYKNQGVMSRRLYDFVKKNYYALGLLSVSFFFFLSLFKTYSFSFSLQAMISDSAIFGLMAQDIKENGPFPFYYYGQNYMGPFSSIIICFIQLFFDFLGIKQIIPYYQLPYSISPMALQFGSIVQFYFGHLFWALGAKKILGQKKSIIFFLILCSGHILFTQNTLRPVGAEMAYFFSALIFYLYYRFNESTHKAMNRFTFGLLFYFSLWANQTVVFVWGAIFLHYFFQSNSFLYLKENWDLKRRLNLSRFPLNIKGRAILKFILLLISFNFLIGVIVSFYFGVFQLGKFKIPNGFDHIKVSIFLFFAIQILLEIFYFVEFKKVFRNKIHKIRFFLGGIVAGMIPLLIGRLFNLYQKAYGIKFKLILFSDYPLYLKKFFTHFIPGLLIGDPSPIYWPLIIFLIILCVLIIIKEKNHFINSPLFIPILIFILNFIFLILSERAREQYALRYGIIMIPSFYLILLAGMNKFTKITTYICYSLIFLVLILFNRQRIDVITAVRDVDQFYQKEILDFKEKNIKTCFADYWDAYRLEFLTGRNVIFLPYQSQDRTPLRTARLAPSTKCYYQKKIITVL